MALPPCGLYRTTLALDHVPAGRLIFFHNHGNPGPGIYLPSGWALNRAQWHEQGHTIPSPEWAGSLVALPAEGLYRVRERFTCCEKQCRTYDPDLLVQLGYDGEADALLFLPEWTPAGLAIPELGTRIDAERLASLTRLTVAVGQETDGPSH